jgi:DNA-binding HxlR family transcriptional regulator
MQLGVKMIEDLLLDGYHSKSPWTPIKGFLNLFKDKWSFLVLLHLTQDTNLRFGQLQKKIPSISNKVLSKSLLQLEKAGLIERMEFIEFPLRVEYQSTAKGKRFLEYLVALIDCFIKQ